jgi:hypothetical protein
MTQQVSPTPGASSSGRAVVTDRADRIREHAYQIWEEQGRPEGRDREHWHAAERQCHEALDAEGTQECDGNTSKAASVTAKLLAS